MNTSLPKELKEQVEKEAEKKSIEYYVTEPDYREVFNDGASFLYSLLSTPPESSTWIAVETALPEADGGCIVYFINKAGRHVGWAYYKDFKFYDDPDNKPDSVYNLVTHWQPLPTPPKIENK